MEVAVGLVTLVCVVGLVAALCRRTGWPTPLVLLVVGVVGSFLPCVPHVEIEPEVVLIGLLPPLLYATALRASLFDFRQNKVATLLMSVLLVVFTTVAVGLVTWWVLPAVSLAAALALGAVVAPPDAIAATAVGRRLGLPRRITTLLEEESLVNDATALVALGVAVSALTAVVTPFDVGVSFLIAAGGGIAIGVVVALLLAAVRKRITDPVLDTLLSFVAPYLAFLPAEAVHASGVLSVVITGLFLAYRSPTVQTASSRVAEATNWRSIAFVLENVVFLLIGLQLPALLAAAGDSGLAAPTIAAVCLAVLVATIAARFVFVFACVLVFSLGSAGMRRIAWPADVATVVSWAGMRGVVTLAAALVLPEETPHREVLVLAAFVVVLGTLLVQGLTLPWLVRRMKLPAPDPADDALLSAELTETSTRAGLRRLEEIVTGDEPESVIRALRERASTRSNTAWERLGRPHTDLETPSGIYTRLRRQMLAAEREAIVRARDAGEANEDVVHTALKHVDVEESMLEHVTELDPLDPDRNLVAQRAEEQHCEHLRGAPSGAGELPQACVDCLREGTTWVHLRVCLTCGHVGCCDSSDGRHARAHFHDERHPVVRSGEPGEAWRWCWVDEEVG
ncbi:Na+/H+ antiporter [Umezawaea beigongshangensis]|uniref:Na+/H+ antiporter n=1 Tax=Umezawaea beigongshangensis TaxID=2780383 RepID=UPI0018F26005|nr:Na+/H+ antiporter [Umezawaea beigongshangensis]